MAKNPAAVVLGRKGGQATAAKLTSEERKESARNAAEARWAKLRSTVADISSRAKELEKRATRRVKVKKEKQPK